MKKNTIVIIMLLVSICIAILLLINNKNKQEEQDKGIIYNRETKNYINNTYYSSRIEKYEITDSHYKYTEEIIYADKDEEKISHLEKGTLTKENDEIILDNNITFKLMDNIICLKEDLNKCYSINSTIVNNSIKDFYPENYFINFNKIDFSKIEEDFKFIVLHKYNCAHCQGYRKELAEVLKDYKFNIYFVDVESLKKKNLEYIKENYTYTGTPTTIIMYKDEVIANFTGAKKRNEIKEILYKNNIERR